MVTDTTLLGPGPLLATRSFKSIANPSHSVSLSSIPRTVHRLTCLRSEIPSWKRLITQALSTDQCISLVTAIFSDPNQVEAVIKLSKDDSQPFVDKIDEASATLPHADRN